MYKYIYVSIYILKCDIYVLQFMVYLCFCIQLNKHFYDQRIVHVLLMILLKCIFTKDTLLAQQCVFLDTITHFALFAGIGTFLLHC